MTMQVTVLGSTGSIGTNTLDVVARHLDLYQVFALSAHSQVDLLLAQCLQFKPRYAVMTSATAARALREGLQQAGSRVEDIERARNQLEEAEALALHAGHVNDVGPGQRFF